MPTPPHWVCSSWGCMVDPTHFVSPPNALHDYAGWECWMYLEGDGVENIPNGRVTFWLYLTSEAFAEIPFRCQWYPTWPLCTRCYYIHIGFWYPISLWLINEGPPVKLGEYAPNFTPDTWERYRITWGSGCTPDALPTFQVIVERWDGAAWQNLGSVSDPNDRWADTGQAHVALDIAYEYAWLDDYILEKLA